MSPLIKPWLYSSLMAIPCGLALAFFSAKYNLILFVPPWIGIVISLVPVIGLSCVYCVIFQRGEIDRLYSENYQAARGFMTHAEQKGETAESKEALYAFMNKRDKREIGGNKR